MGSRRKNAKKHPCEGVWGQSGASECEQLGGGAGGRVGNEAGGKHSCVVGYIVSPQRYVQVLIPPVPANMTLFGNEVFADAIKLR